MERSDQTPDHDWIWHEENYKREIFKINLEKTVEHSGRCIVGMAWKIVAFSKQYKKTTEYSDHWIVGWCPSWAMCFTALHVTISLEIEIKMATSF
jgi:hypothetical protein